MEFLLNVCRCRVSEVSQLDVTEFEIIEEICRIEMSIKDKARRINPLADDYADHSGTRESDKNDVRRVFEISEFPEDVQKAAEGFSGLKG